MYPHTVQAYTFQDPTRGTYGRQNFSFMLDWLMDFAAQSPRREVVYKPESAYWGGYDIAVPLLLPIYALKRVQDLRAIAAREARQGVRMDGQVLFSSGWEWGYDTWWE